MEGRRREGRRHSRQARSQQSHRAVAPGPRRGSLPIPVPIPFRLSACRGAGLAACPPLELCLCPRGCRHANRCWVFGRHDARCLGRQVVGASLQHRCRVERVVVVVGGGRERREVGGGQRDKPATAVHATTQLRLTQRSRKHTHTRSRGAPLHGSKACFAHQTPCPSHHHHHHRPALTPSPTTSTHPSSPRQPCATLSKEASRPTTSATSLTRLPEVDALDVCGAGPGSGPGGCIRHHVLKRLVAEQQGLLLGRVGCVWGEERKGREWVAGRGWLVAVEFQGWHGSAARHQFHPRCASIAHCVAPEPQPSLGQHSLQAPPHSPDTSKHPPLPSPPRDPLPLHTSFPTATATPSCTATTPTPSSFPSQHPTLLPPLYPPHLPLLVRLVIRRYLPLAGLKPVQHLLVLGGQRLAVPAGGTVTQRGRYIHNMVYSRGEGVHACGVGGTEQTRCTTTVPTASSRTPHHHHNTKHSPASSTTCANRITSQDHHHYDTASPPHRSTTPPKHNPHHHSPSLPFPCHNHNPCIHAPTRGASQCPQS